MSKFRKETVFEGYYAACWETSFLTKKSESEEIEEGARAVDKRILERDRHWLREYLQSLLNQKRSGYHLFFDDIFPKRVFETLLRDLNARFRFKFTVEVEEI